MGLWRRYYGMKQALYSLFILLMTVATSCIEDGFTTAPADAPVAADTLHMGTVFTEQRTPTFRFAIHNRASKSVTLTSLRMGGPTADRFRLCVDGFSGTEFADVEIRNNDSIIVLVDALLPANGSNEAQKYKATVDFEACGVGRSVVVDIKGRDAVRLEAVTLTADTRLTAEKPYLISDSLVVASGATLTIDAGAELCFHDGAYLRVRGGLQSLGSAQQPVSMAGDRTGNVVADISFDIMSRQWEGVRITEADRPVVLSHTDVRNTWEGVVVACSRATLLNSRLHNSAGFALAAVEAEIDAVGCEFAEGGAGLVYLEGGRHSFNHCTLGNNYLFAAIEGAAVELAEPADITADFANCIIYGLGSDMSHGDLRDTAVTLRRCLLKSDGTDDDNFLNCIWNTDPLYHTVRADYLFDYRLQQDSPAIGAADPALTDPRAATDAYGTPRADAPSLGAYEYVEL